MCSTAFASDPPEALLDLSHHEIANPFALDPLPRFDMADRLAVAAVEYEAARTFSAL